MRPAPTPGVAAAARDSFVVAHRILGNLIGETLGYLFTAAWTLLVLVALGRTIAGRWFTALGAVSAVLVLAGVLSPLDLPVIDLANFIGYVLRSIWLVVFGLLLLRRPRTATAAPRASTLHRRRPMTIMEPSTPSRQAFFSWLIWTAGFVSFPIAGVAAGLITGRVDDPVAALVAGVVTGAVIGVGQWLVSRARLRPMRWILATAVGMGLGLLLGASAVGFDAALSDLVVMGALTAAWCRSDPGPTRCYPLSLGLGCRDTPALDARLDRDHARGSRCREAVLRLRRRRRRHILRPLRGAAECAAAGSRLQPDRRRTPGRRQNEGRRMTGTPRHAIFGTGAIGLATLDALLRRGETVRMVNRSGTARVPEEVEVVGGDAADPQFTIEVTRGARVVHQTLNPPYERWVEEFPALQAGVLAAAEAQDARLVSMENVYMYGRPAGCPLTETRDYAAHTKKGKLRGQMATELLAAHP